MAQPLRSSGMNDFLNSLDEETSKVSATPLDLKKREQIAALWKKKQISKDEMDKFGLYFEKADPHRIGKISLDQGLKLLSRSGVEQHNLTKIWALADQNKDQYLNREEFILAMYLIQCVLEGDPLPEKLPSTLMPEVEKYGVVPTAPQRIASKDKLADYGTIEQPLSTSGGSRPNSQYYSPIPRNSPLPTQSPLSSSPSTGGMAIPAGLRPSDVMRSSGHLPNPGSSPTPATTVADPSKLLAPKDDRSRSPSPNRNRPQSENYGAMPKVNPPGGVKPVDVVPVGGANKTTLDPKGNYSAIPKLAGKEKDGYDAMPTPIPKTTPQPSPRPSPTPTPVASPPSKDNYGAIPRNEPSTTTTPNQPSKEAYGAIPKDKQPASPPLSVGEKTITANRTPPKEDYGAIPKDQPVGAKKPAVMYEAIPKDEPKSNELTTSKGKKMGETPYNPLPAPPESRAPLLQSQGSGLLLRDASKPKLTVAPGRTLKITVLGESSGKSAIISRLIFDDFHDRVEPTVEDNFTYDLTYNNKQYKLKLLDTSSNESYIENMAPKWLQDSDGILLVYSVADKVSFTMLDQFAAKVKQIIKDDRIPVIVVGNKIDLPRQVSAADAIAWTDKKNWIYIECSAKMNQQVTKIFEILIDKSEGNYQKGLSFAKPHNFEKQKLKTPKNCVKCNGVIWGVVKRTGRVCKACGVGVHKHCLNTVPLNCGQVSGTRIKTNKDTVEEFLVRASGRELGDALKDDESSNRFSKFLSDSGLDASAVAFWKECDRYKLAPPDRRKEIATLIFNAFIHKNVNKLGLAPKMLKSFEKKYSEAKFPPDLFDELQSQVFERLTVMFSPFAENELKQTMSQLKEEIEIDDDGEISQVVKKPSAESLLIPKQRRQTAQYDSLPFRLPESEWLYLDLSRIDAEKILNGPSDYFLVRSSSFEGCFALSKFSVEKNSFIHWVIAPLEGGYYLKDCLEDPAKYTSVHDLVSNTKVLRGAFPVGQQKVAKFLAEKQ